jgi:hypothetical protein
MRRIQIVTLVGLVVVISALLYVINGSSHDMVWMYEYCVAWQPINCTSGNAMSVHCHIVGSICVRTEPRLQSWVYTWIVESVIEATGIALVARITGHNLRARIAVFRVAIWSVIGALGYIVALEYRLTSVGASTRGIDTVVPIFLEVFFAALVGLGVALLALRALSNRGFEVVERLPWPAVATFVLIIGGACGWRGLGL